MSVLSIVLITLVAIPVLPVLVYYCVFFGVRAKRRAEKHNP
jgi:heme/copper-type cytochrome/quinol oxidase subunit 2